MSPEQASGDDVDARTDIYAWAVIAYELLSGQHPFPGHTTSAALIRAHIAEKPRSLSAARPDIPRVWVDLVMRSLDKDPKNRPANGRELLSVLTSGTTSERLEARKKSRYTRIGIGALAAIVVGVAVALAVARSQQSAESKTFGRVGDKSGTSAEPKAVGVLPFVNVGGDPSQEYFSDGITDEIADALARIPGLRLASRTSAFAFKGRSGIDARTIGKELNVSSLLEGQVLRSGDRLRVSTQLTDSKNGLVLWRNSYERQMKDVFVVQTEIAKSIASALQVTLSDAKPMMVAKTANMDAHDAYLRARFEHEKYTGEGIRRAIALYDSAISLDPRYGDPRAALALAWINLADDWIAPKDALPEALAAAKGALKLDSTNANAYAALLASTKFTTVPEVRRKQLDKAAALAPNDPSILAALSVELIPFNPAEAIPLARRAYMLDSTSQTTTIYYSTALVIVGRPAEALQPVEAAIKRGAAIPFVHYVHGEALLALGRAREALESYRIAEAALPDAARMGMARAYAALGQPQRAIQFAKALEADAGKRYVSKDYIAQIYAELGEKDEAFKWLDRAADDRSGYLTWLGVSPAWASLRSDPRFAALKARLRLP
jgi:serine/threonine-protein kinase